MWHRIQIMQTHFNSNVGETRHHLFVTRFLYTGAFGQYANSLANLFTNSICECRSRKRKKLLDLTVFLALLGSSGVKAAHKMMAKLTPAGANHKDENIWCMTEKALFCFTNFCIKISLRNFVCSICTTDLLVDLYVNVYW